jgi:flagellar hook-associated protein 3 FlgL
MRVSDLSVITRYLNYDKAQQEKIQKYNAQLASGKKILKPSDNAIDTVRSLRFKSLQKTLESYLRNMDLARTTQNVAETSLKNTQDASYDAKVELVQLLNTGVFDEEDAVILKDYLKDLRNYMVRQANTKVGDKYLFGGVKSQTEPFDALGFYHGETKETDVPIAETTEVNSTFNGRNYFGTENTYVTSVSAATLTEIADSGSFKIENIPLEKKSINITTFDGTSVSYKDDGDGKIIDTSTSTQVGTVDYEDGIITITAAKNTSANETMTLNYNYYEKKIGIIKAIDDAVSIIEDGDLKKLHGKISSIGNEDATSTFNFEDNTTTLTETTTTSGSYQISQTPVTKKSIFISKHNATDVNWKDDGNGNIIDLDNSNETVGTINYTTGLITITQDTTNPSSNTITLNNNVIIISNSNATISIAYDNDNSDSRYASSIDEIVTKINNLEENQDLNNQNYFTAYTFTDSSQKVRLGVRSEIESNPEINISVNGDLSIKMGDFKHILETFDNGFEKVGRYRSILGTQMKLIDDLKMQHENFKTNYNELVSKLEDADLVKVIGELEKAKTAYQATMAAYMQNRKLSLLEFFK